MTDLPTTDPRLIVLSGKDNIAVAAEPVAEGETVRIDGVDVFVSERIGMGHKIAIRSIASGADVFKYGLPIGFASVDIPVGSHVHVHNLSSRYTAVEIME